MDITVILCTYNRSETLWKALASVASQELPDSVTWEVLIVDNNSSDQTRDVVEQFCREHPNRFRYLFEARSGKSHALNAGIKEARGNIVAFMDDDVIVAPRWLSSLTVSLLDGRCAGAGGRIFPLWNSTAPKWLPLVDRLCFGPLVMFDLGSESGSLREPPIGTNMAFRKEMFDQYGAFRRDLGPRPGSEIRGEDSEFGSRLLRAGEQLRYEPSAVVYHPVLPGRIRKEYFLDWWFDKARADIRAEKIIPETKWQIAGVPLYLFRRVLVWTARWWFTFDSSERFSYKINVWINVGSIIERYQQSPTGKVLGRTTEI